MDDYYIQTTSGDPFIVRDAEVVIDPVENSLILTQDDGAHCKFNWSNVFFYTQYKDPRG